MKTRKMWAVYAGQKLICIGISRPSALRSAGVYMPIGCKWTDKELKEQYNVVVKLINITIEAIK